MQFDPTPDRKCHCSVSRANHRPDVPFGERRVPGRLSRGVGGGVGLCRVIGTYIAIAALAHDFGFGLGWVVASTALVWAAPAQVILVSALATGGGAVETALAVGVSSARLLPMVMSLLPLIKRPQTPPRALILPAHLTP
jgi:hypothetical protein